MVNHYLVVLSHFQILILILVDMKIMEIIKMVYLKAVGYDSLGTVLSYVKISIFDQKHTKRLKRKTLC